MRPSSGVKQLRDSLVSQKNTVIDLGEDEFTVGRPHPMIDYSLRNRRILEEAADPGTAVILLDVVLGYGSNPDPAAEIGGGAPQGGAEGCGGLFHHRHGSGPAEPEPGGGGAAQGGRDRDAVQRRGVQAGGTDHSVPGAVRQSEGLEAMNPINQLFRSELKVINLGLAAFKQALDDARVPAVQVDWKPSVEVDPKLRQRVRASQAAIEQANARVMKIILGGMPHLVGLERAIDVIPGMKPDLLLHAGPPITWDRMCGPMRGAIIGALLYERKGRDRRRSPAARGVGRDQVRSLPRACGGGADGRRRLALDAGVRAEERGAMATTPTAR